jgi:hypothetical protein
VTLLSLFGGVFFFIPMQKCGAAFHLLWAKNRVEKLNLQREYSMLKVTKTYAEEAEKCFQQAKLIGLSFQLVFDYTN